MLLYYFILFNLNPFYVNSSFSPNIFCSCVYSTNISGCINNLNKLGLEGPVVSFFSTLVHFLSVIFSFCLLKKKKKFSFQKNRNSKTYVLRQIGFTVPHSGPIHFVHCQVVLFSHSTGGIVTQSQSGLDER